MSSSSSSSIQETPEQKFVLEKLKNFFERSVPLLSVISLSWLDPPSKEQPDARGKLKKEHSDSNVQAESKRLLEHYLPMILDSVSAANFGDLRKGILMACLKCDQFVIALIAPKINEEQLQVNFTKPFIEQVKKYLEMFRKKYHIITPISYMCDNPTFFAQEPPSPPKKNGKEEEK